MDRYQKVEKPKPEIPINANEIRITSQGLIRNYLTYANTLLNEKHAEEIELKAMGQAISKTVTIAEILKTKVPLLHQDTAISSVSLTDTWEPIEEGLQPVETTRQVSMISITLSTKELNRKSSGYQAPYNAEQLELHNQYQQQQPRQARAPYNAADGDSYGQRRGRGRGRRRGRGRQGYGDYYQDNGGYTNWGQVGGGQGRNFYDGDGYEGARVGGGYEGARGRGGYEGGRGGRGRGGYEGARVGGGRGGYEVARGGGSGGGYEGARGGGGRGDYEGSQGGGGRGGYEAGRSGGSRGGYDEVGSRRGGRGGYDEGGSRGGGYGEGGNRRGGRGGYNRGRGRRGGRSGSGDYYS